MFPIVEYINMVLAPKWEGAPSPVDLIRNQRPDWAHTYELALSFKELLLKRLNINI